MGYKSKTQADGSVERDKARLVAKSFTEEYGIDYEETFSYVAHLTSVCILITVPSSNGELTDEVYIQPPLGYDHPPNKVCHLRKALCGLKQAS